MRHIRIWRRNHRAGFLLLACYTVALLLLLGMHLGLLVANRVMHANGTLAQQELTADDFELVEMQPYGDGGNTFVTTGGDPQMVLKDGARRVDHLEIEFSYSQPPLLVNVFYAPQGSDWSVRRMAYPAEQGGEMEFLLPVTGAQRLRIDPGSVPGNIVEVHRITVNSSRAWAAFFIPSAAEWLFLLMAPAFAASALWAVRQLKALPRAKHLAATGKQKGGGAS